MSITRFKQPIQLAELPDDPSDIENGTLYYNSTSNKVITAQNGVFTDTVSTEELNNIVDSAISVVTDEIQNHMEDTNNPHSVTKSQIGLGNCDNTSDVNKPVSTATQTALNLKANQSTTYTKIETDTLLNAKEPSITVGTTAQYWRGDKSWQTLNKAAVGLGNVDNTSDLNKPISTATQTALDLKANQATTYTKTETDTLLNGKQPLNAALTSLSGLATNGILIKNGSTLLTRSVTVTSPISVSNGDGILGNIAISHAVSGVTAATYGSATQTPVAVVNATGHVTGMSVVDTKPNKLNYLTAAATASVSTTTSTYADVSGMSLTLPDIGTYLIVFNGDVYVEGSGEVIGDVILDLAGTTVTGSLRSISITVTMLLGLIGNTYSRPSGNAIIMPVTTTAVNQVVKVRWRRTSSGGTVYCTNRNITSVRIN